MLSSISPLGERARASRWWLTTAAYLLGSTAGGLALGVLAAAVGAVVPGAWRDARWAPALVATALVIGLALDLRSDGNGVPSWRRQVDEAWIGRYRGWVYGLGFGVQLGFGLVTIVTSTTTYAVALTAAWSGDLGAGAVLGGTFGLVRALPSLLLARVRTREQLWRVLRRVESAGPAADRVAKVSLTIGAAAMAALAIGGGS